MSEFKIEKGIAMPEGKNGRPYKYPWRDLDIGDSFFVPANKVPKSGLKTAASVVGARSGKRFITRTVDGGVRVWRTK